MIIQIPVGFQPQVGQVHEFRVKGMVTDLNRNPESGDLVATVEITDPSLEGSSEGFPPVTKDRKISLRAEMRGGG